MADLDLAVEQEEWNDFTDDTTSSPPPVAPGVSSPLPEAAPTTPMADSVDGISFVGSVGGDKFDGREDHGSNGTGGDELKIEASFGEQAESNIDGGDMSPPLVASTTDMVSSLGVEGSLPVISEIQQGMGLPEKASALPIVAEGGDLDDEWGDFEEAGGFPGDAVAGEGVNIMDNDVNDGEPRDNVIHTDDGKRGNAEEGDGIAVEAVTGAPGGEAVNESENTPSGDGVGEAKVDICEGLTADDASGIQHVGVSAEDGSPKLLDESDPFAEITPPSPSTSTTVGVGLSSLFDGMPMLGGQARDEPEASLEEESKKVPGDSKEQDGDVGYRSDVVAATENGKVYVPLSLRGLRDGLAARGMLEEAREVQNRMELPILELNRRKDSIQGDGDADRTMGGGEAGQEASGTGISASSRDRESVNEHVDDHERDLERWRGLMKVPPAPTLDEMAQTLESLEGVDSSAERFRDRFVKGRPPVEEEALAAGGGGRSLTTALRRQRAARRALLLIQVLRKGKRGKMGGVEGTTSMDQSAATLEEFMLDIGEPGGRKCPPTLSDWANIVSYITHVVQAGLDVLRVEDDLLAPDVTPSGSTATKAEKKSPECAADSAEDEMDGDHAEDAASPRVRGGAEGRNSPIAREVVRSARFGAFSRGLREAMRVCRLLQAAAEDSLETIEGYDALESKWEAFQRRLGEVASASGADDDWMASGADAKGNEGPVLKPPTEEGSWSPFFGENGNDRAVESTEGVLPSVRSIQDEALAKPAETSLCAVCLQPLEVFGIPTSSSIIEYCGVRYLARAVNLWVNVLDKAPPRLPASSVDSEEGIGASFPF